MPKIQRQTAVVTLATLLSDTLVLLASLLLAYWISFFSPFAAFFPVIKGVPPLGEYLNAFPVLLLVFWVVFKGYKLYRRKTYLLSSWNFFLITRAVTVAIFSLMALTFLYRDDFTYSRRLVVWDWFFCIVLLTVSRRIIDRVGLWWWRKSKFHRRVLLLGEGPVAQRLQRNFHANPLWSLKVEGVIWIDSPPPPESFPSTEILGRMDDFEQVIAEHSIDEVILTRLDLPHSRIMKIILECEKRMISVKLVPDVFSILTNRVGIVNLDGIPLLGLRDLPLHSAWNRFLKRIFDLAATLIGLILSLPFLLVSALAVKLTSRGPVFFKQERMGENGHLFNLYKLRTMPVDVEKVSGPVLPAREDPRATPVGRVLRRFGLDELPQLWNIFKGDMSLVGPRPERKVFVEKFKESIPRYMSRHLVKSGVTGWAQANGLRGDTSIKTRVEYDLYYLENWSLLFDLKIILLTLFSRRVRG